MTDSTPAPQFSTGQDDPKPARRWFTTTPVLVFLGLCILGGGVAALNHAVNGGGSEYEATTTSADADTPQAVCEQRLSEWANYLVAAPANETDWLYAVGIEKPLYHEGNEIAHTWRLTATLSGAGAADVAAHQKIITTCHAVLGRGDTVPQMR